MYAILLFSCVLMLFGPLLRWYLSFIAERKEALPYAKNVQQMITISRIPWFLLFHKFVSLLLSMKQKFNANF